jgi:hypothetical protein
MIIAATRARHYGWKPERPLSEGGWRLAADRSREGAGDFTRLSMVDFGLIASGRETRFPAVVRLASRQNSGLLRRLRSKLRY